MPQPISCGSPNPPVDRWGGRHGFRRGPSLHFPIRGPHAYSACITVGPTLNNRSQPTYTGAMSLWRDMKQHPYPNTADIASNMLCLAFRAVVL